MKPNFALSLSFEGIRLLHRAAGGWRIVGAVALNAPDMTAELAVLRRTATALEPSGLRTKLLLPNAQIKYLTVDTIDMDDAARLEAARVALDGATPYPVADLAFDISADGTRTHVAAVARETLAEAEDFAAEHRFNPISFAAIPDDQPYLGEPFFGPTPSALAALKNGETIEAEGIAVVVIGDVIAGDDAVADTPENGGETVDAPTEDTVDEPGATLFQDSIASDQAEKIEPAEEDAVDEGVAKDEAVTNTAEDTTDSNDAARVDVAKNVLTENELTEDQPSADVTSKKPEAEQAAKSAETETPPAKAKLPIPPVFKTRAVIADNALKPEAAQDVAPFATVETARTAIDASAPEEMPELPTQSSPSLKKSEGNGIVAAPSLGPASRSTSAVNGSTTVNGAEAAHEGGFASRRVDVRTPAAPPPRREPAVNAPVGKAQALAAMTAARTTPQSAPPTPAPSKTATSFAVASSAAAPIGGFLSRRKANAAAASISSQPAMAAAGTAPRSEAEQMTIFGARRNDVRGKPRFLGLILTAALLVFLAGVAAWASVFLDDGLNLSRLFGDRTAREIVSNTTDPAPSDLVVIASLDPTLTPEDTAVLDALRDPVPLPDTQLSQQELEAVYGATGIWSQAPNVPPEPIGLVSIDDLYLTSLDPVSTSNDAVALPTVASFVTDLPLGTLASPASAGTVFTLNPNGLVIATATGAISPNGYTVYAGRPPLTPPATLARFQAVPQDDALSSALAGFRPKDRPDDLAEQNERAQLDGLTRNELSGERPKLRPRSIQQQAKAAATKLADDAKAEQAKTEDDAEAAAVALAVAAANPFQDATRFAAKASARPDTRPRNFNRIVRRAKRTPQPKAEETRVASTATIAPRTVKPKIPTKTSVARQATVKNAINLRKVNLIGVYGKPSNRRALVRLGNGRYKKVTVGDRIDGGRVSAISNSELRYRKGSRNVVLKMP